MKTRNNIIFLSLLILAACGGGSGGGSSDKAQNQQSNEDFVEAAPGKYYTVLRPVNFQSNGFIPYGMSTFTMINDQLQVSISVDDDQAVPHRQNLHLGSRCPTLADDTNGDGFVDYDEAQRVVGPVVMPLDSDLNSQAAGKDVHPRGPGMTYNRMASISKINADLWVADEDPSDNVTKLSPEKGIGFERRVVLVHGTSFQNFPATLATHRNEPAHLSMPIVCGVLEKVE